MFITHLAKTIMTYYELLLSAIIVLFLDVHDTEGSQVSYRSGLTWACPWYGMKRWGGGGGTDTDGIII